MRTTVSLDEHLLAEAKARAHRRHQTLGQLIEDALRREMAAEPGDDRPRIPTFTGGTGPAPGLDLTSNRALHEALDADRAIHELR